MNEVLESLKTVFEGEATLLIKNPWEIIKLSEKNNHVEKIVIDRRFEQLQQIIVTSNNKSDVFYADLIKEISIYIEQLYDRDIDFCNVNIISTDEEAEFPDTIFFNCSDTISLKERNRSLAGQLFDYVCGILESNKDVKVDVDTLKRLFNCNPKLFTLSVEESYLKRPFAFDRLAKIINNNQTLQKSNIHINEIYGLLIDTCQVDNAEIFTNLVKPEQYKINHQKIKDLLMECNARIFIAVTRIIKTYFDKDFDRLKMIKQRNKNSFCSTLIIELLHCQASKDDFNLIHQLLIDPEIEIDYDLYSADYRGRTNLKSVIALSENKIIIKDLLSKEQNIQNYYRHGDFGVYLYVLYAIIGDYEKALVHFEGNYNFKNDLDDEDNNWDKYGFAYGGYGYEDSLGKFISSLCTSFKENCVDYSMMKSIIHRIINNKNVKYINLEKTLTPIREVLLPEDFKLFVDALVEKYNSGSLNFLVVSVHQSMFERYIINVASKKEIQNQLSKLREKKVLSYKKREDTKH